MADDVSELMTRVEIHSSRTETPSSVSAHTSTVSIATVCFSQTERYPEPKQAQAQNRAHRQKQMASEQIHQRDHNKKNDVERDLVPKMTSHYESLAEKAKDPAITIVGGKDPPGETTTTTNKTEHESPSKMTEKPVETAKRGGGGGEKGGKVKEKVVEGASGTTQYLADKSKEGFDAVKETVVKAKDYTVEAGHKVAEIAAKPLVAAKDAAVAVGDRAKEATSPETEQMEQQRQV